MQAYLSENSLEAHADGRMHRLLWHSYIKLKEYPGIYRLCKTGIAFFPQVLMISDCYNLYGQPKDWSASTLTCYV